MEIGRDLLQSGVSEEAGSWGWFLQRRGGSSTPKRRKSNDGLSFSFMSKFGTLRVDDQSSQPPDPASFRNQWKTSHSFSDSGELSCFFLAMHSGGGGLMYDAPTFCRVFQCVVPL